MSDGAKIVIAGIMAYTIYRVAVLIVTVKIFGDLCLDIPIKCTLWFEKNIEYLTSGLYWFPLDISSRIDGESSNDRFLT